MLAHVEEVVLATSGEDAFELVFSVAATRILGSDVRARYPALGAAPLGRVDRALVARVDALLAGALSTGDPRLEALDAVFEALVSRVSKGQKGQFFTPRHVVDFVIRMLAPRAGEVVVDPACGSGAFLAHARAHADVRAYGCDVDARAVRVARLLALAGRGDADAILRTDGLRTSKLPVADVVATNPPFAGRADAEGFEIARHVRTPERDVLFLERAIDLLRPGGRLGIVLPYNKAAGEGFARLRRWLSSRARIERVVGLPRETFLPHTSQRCFVLFASKRARGEAADLGEATTLVLSARAGKDAAGEPTVFGHDLDDVASGRARSVVRTLEELGDGIVLAPERHLVKAGEGVALADLVVERSERFDPKRLARAIVVDTTHAKDGLLDLASAQRAASTPKSAKKLAQPGDLIVSRLRPYLRQVALVTRELAVSTEFYVLGPRAPGEDLAYLVPFLLSERVQATLAGAQEGGHHPRVPRASLFAIRVPHRVVRARAQTSAGVRRALVALERAERDYRALIEASPSR